MTVPIYTLLCVLFLSGAVGLSPCYAGWRMADLKEALSEELVCHRIDLMGLEKQELAVTSKNFCLTAVYDPKNLKPYWVTPRGPRPKAKVVLDFLKKAEAEGLDPRNYEVGQIAALFAEREPRLLAQLETLLTFNLIKYIHDVSSGQIKPRFAEPGLFPEAGDINFKPRLTMDGVLKAKDLAAYLAGLPPAHRHYKALKKALKTYRALEKDESWPLIAPGSTMRPGDNDTRIPGVIQRLAVTGDLAPGIAVANPGKQYAPELEGSVVRFQKRHGLAPDAAIGKKTLAALNVPAADRIRQIIINMTRWRWQSHDLGDRYIVVNIAHFDLIAFEEGDKAFSFPVIVGKFKHQTPIFSHRISYIDINPYWNIPVSIAKNEELPKLKKDAEYLVKRHVRLFSGWGSDAAELDSTAMDWSMVSADMMGQYSLRQDPGPWNALGQIKFVFPNTYDVYLHDTPTQSLFSRNKRDFSHGCIRISDPVKLAVFALSRQNSGDWTREKIEDSIEANERVVVSLSEPLPVYITYQTSWVDRQGFICFNNDIYGRDEKLLKALFNE